jgi:hypothetical protein
LRASGEMDDGLGWKDGDTMHWRVLLTENCYYIGRIGLPDTHALSWDQKETNYHLGGKCSRAQGAIWRE